MDVRIRPWFGPSPDPFTEIYKALQDSPRAEALREPEPEPQLGENLIYRSARLGTRLAWFKLLERDPELAIQILGEEARP